MKEALDYLVTQDPVLKPVIASVGPLDFTESGDIYYDLLSSIVSQQLSGKAATTIFNRFLTLFPDQYPHAERLAALDTTTLRNVGLSNQKAAYLKNVALFSQQFNLEQHDWAGAGDEEIIKLLTQIKGVGTWTVQMLLMFTLNRPDVFPVDDLGIQQGMVKLYQLDAEGKALKKQMEAVAERWRPWRTVACRYVWRWKDAIPKN